MMKELRGTRQDFDTRKKYKFKGDIITEIKKRRSGAKRVRVFFLFFFIFFSFILFLLFPLLDRNFSSKNQPSACVITMIKRVVNYIPDKFILIYCNSNADVLCSYIQLFHLPSFLPTLHMIISYLISCLMFLLGKMKLLRMYASSSTFVPEPRIEIFPESLIPIIWQSPNSTGF